MSLGTYLLNFDRIPASRVSLLHSMPLRGGGPRRGINSEWFGRESVHPMLIEKDIAGQIRFKYWTKESRASIRGIKHRSLASRLSTFHAAKLRPVLSADYPASRSSSLWGKRIEFQNEIPMCKEAVGEWSQQVRSRICRGRPGKTQDEHVTQ